MSKTNIRIISVLGVVCGILTGFLGLTTGLAFLALFFGTIIVLSKYEIATYSLALYVFLDFVLRLVGGAVGNLWDETLFLAMILLWIYKWIVDVKETRIKVTPIDGGLILFYGVSLVLLFINSVDFSQGLEGFRAVIQHTLWYFPVIQLVRDKKDCRNIYRLLILVCLFISLHGIYQYIVKVEMPENWIDSVETGIRTRVYSIIGSPNILGSLMTLTIPMAVALFFAEKKPLVKIFYLMTVVSLGLCLVFTSSRGAWIGFIAAVFIYVTMKDKRLLIPVAIVALLVAVLIPSVSSRLIYMLSPEYIESSLRGGRLVRWLEGIEMVSVRPFLGVGLGQFGGAVAVNNEVRDVFYMDNYYLKTAVEMGLVGLTAFLVLMYNVFTWSLRASVRIIDPYYKELSIGAFAGLFGVMVHNVVENVFEVPMMTAYFWIITALIMYWFTHLQLKEKPTV